MLIMWHTTTLEKGRGIFITRCFFNFVYLIIIDTTCYVLLVGFVISYGHGQHKPGD